MDEVRKTVRFYNKYIIDRQALDVLENYQEYGFVSERQIIIWALAAFKEERGLKLGTTNNKMGVEPFNSGHTKTSGLESRDTGNDETIKIALNFIEEL